MQLKRWTTLLALTCAVACAEAPEEGGLPAARTIRVEVGSGPRIDLESRTELGELEGDRQTVRWSTDDRIALWAIDAEGNAALQAEPFALWHYNASFDNARFTAEIPEMAAGSYTYYALSPAPANWEGTRATYEIPAVQNGRFDGAYDIMVAADPVTGPALTEGDNSARVSFEFIHKVHLLKLRIPENKLGERISRLEILFPEPVVGKLTVDAADPTAAAELTEGGNTLTIEFPEPVEADADTYFYAAVAPIRLSDTDAIRVKAYGEMSESKTGLFTGRALSLKAGRITPIALTVPEAGIRYTVVDFDLPDTGEATLGEKVRSMTFTAPEGVQFDNGHNVRTFAVSEAGPYRMVFREYPAGLSQQQVEVSFDSEHAAVACRIALPALEQGAVNTVRGLRVPYLFEEDFGSVGGFSNHDNAGGGTTIDTYTSAIALDEYNLAGWSATRCGAEEGNALRICVRTEDGLFALKRYHGRVDTAPMANIKAGTAVRVKVSFDYSMATSRSEHIPRAAWGYHTVEEQLIAGASSSGATGSTTLSSAVERDIELTGGSYSSIDAHASYVIESCTDRHRLAWEVYSRGRKTGNSNGYLYLDNIRVSIANE